LEGLAVENQQQTTIRSNEFFLRLNTLFICRKKGLNEQIGDRIWEMGAWG